MSESDEVPEVDLSDMDEDCFIDDKNSSSSIDSLAIMSIINTYNAHFYAQPAQKFDHFIKLSIPKSFLPIYIQSVYGFYESTNILEIEFELSDFNWRKTPQSLEVLHPIYHKQYVGRVYIEKIINSFFSEAFKPKKFYKSAIFLLSSQGECDENAAKLLSKEGFDKIAVENVLKVFNNSYEEALKFIRTGDFSSANYPLTIDYQDCPMLYLMLEICDAFIGLYNHCCICGAEIDLPGIKPTTCKNPLCNFTFQELGVGNSLHSEIQRDIYVADLLISLFAAALEDNYCQPCPSDLSIDRMKEIMTDLPSLKDILENCSKDEDIQKFVGDEPYKLLRWIILSNRSQLYCLPDQLKPKIFEKNCVIFMTLLSSPSKDEKFNAIKSTYGSMFLFHGSDLTRWHSILRNGLVNASGTSLEKNGHNFGNGIYFSRESDVSKAYSPAYFNRYINSCLGQAMSVIGLCEVAKSPDLKDQGRVHTLQDESAVVVRFIILNLLQTYDVVSTPPDDIPSIKDVLDFQTSPK